MLENVGTDKPAVMKINVPTWSPIEFHDELYLSGAGCQALGPVFLSPGLLWWNVTANRGRAGLPRTNLCLESWKSFDFSFFLCFSAASLIKLKLYLCLFCLGPWCPHVQFSNSSPSLNQEVKIRQKEPNVSFSSKAESGQQKLGR